MSGSSEKVIIYSDKTGKKLCEIKVPQKWHWSIPIPPIVIHRYDVWKNPEAVRKWAWQQAYIITAYLNEIGVTRAEDLLPPTFSCRCLVCGQDTIKPSYTHWRWSRHYKFTGFTCCNKECSMFQVELPKIICGYLDEMPMEYLPTGWAKPTKPESDQEQP